MLDEADELAGQVWWSPAINHRFCKDCQPHAFELAAMVGRALDVIERLRGRHD